MVRKGGLEPPRYCYRQPLKLVDLLWSCELTRILRLEVSSSALTRTPATTLFAHIRYVAGRHAGTVWLKASDARGGYNDRHGVQARDHRFTANGGRSLPARAPDTCCDCRLPGGRRPD